MDLVHWLTRSGLTYPEVSSKVYYDSFCQLGSSVSLHWVIYFEAFYLHVLSSFSRIPVVCPKLVLLLTPLQFAHMFCNVSKWIVLLCTQQVKLGDAHSYLKVEFGKERRTRWTASGCYLKRPWFRVSDHISGRPSKITNWWRNLHSAFLGAFRSTINSKRDDGQRPWDCDSQFCI